MSFIILMLHLRSRISMILEIPFLRSTSIQLVRKFLSFLCFCQVLRRKFLDWEISLWFLGLTLLVLFYFVAGN